MAISSMRRQPIDRETAIQELKRGHESMAQLQSLLQTENWRDNSSELANDLSREVVQALKAGLSFLTSSKTPAQPRPNKGSGKRAKFDQNVKDQRTKQVSGIMAIYAYRTNLITTVPDYDNYQWRKYGQKRIRNAEYPRSYYRCTHKGCPVTKQVQQKEGNNPPMFLVTYLGQHTCSTTMLHTFKSTAEASTPHPLKEPALMLNFEWNFGSTSGIQHEQRHVLSPLISSKKDSREEMFTPQSTDNCSSSFNPTVTDLTTSRSMGETTTVPDNNRGFVSSTCPSPEHAWDWDCGVLFNDGIEEPPDHNHI